MYSIDEGFAVAWAFLLRVLPEVRYIVHVFIIFTVIIITFLALAKLACKAIFSLLLCALTLSLPVLLRLHTANDR